MRLTLLYFLFTKICVSKNPSLQLQVLSTFWQLYNGIFSSIAIGRQMSPQTHQNFSSYLIFFSCISSSFSASLHSRPSVVLRVAAQNEVDSWIRGAVSCSEGGDLLVGQPRGCPDLEKSKRVKSIEGVINWASI
jgi:hypothetical protein